MAPTISRRPSQTSPSIRRVRTSCSPARRACSEARMIARRICPAPSGARRAVSSAIPAIAIPTATDAPGAPLRGEDGARGNRGLTSLAHAAPVLTPLETTALPAAPDLAAAVVGWLGHLRHERRLAAHTLEAYGRDVRQFLGFLAERFDAPPAIADFVGIVPADLRAFLARRRAAEIEGR